MHTQERARELGEGDVVGRYRILHALGSRPARVYAAVDVETGARVALKPLWPRATADGVRETEDHAVARLRREADVLEHLPHPSFPRLLEAALHDDPPMLVLELIDAVELEQALSTRSKPMGSAELSRLLAGIADALAALHQNGFVHGDLHPSNILIRTDGEPGLVDLGSARAWLKEPSGENETSISLTPNYAAPEQQQAGREIGPWTDVYALGAVAYRLVTGRAPLPARERLQQRAMASAVEVGNAAYPLATRAIVDWCLEMDPSSRPASMAELRDALCPASASRDEDSDAAAATLRVRRLRTRAAAPAPTGHEAVATVKARRRRPTLAAAAILGATAVATLVGFGFVLYAERTRTEWLVDAGGGGDATSVNEALSRAPPGSTIRVKPGVYRESLHVVRPVTIVGLVEGGALPVLQPPAGRCVLLEAEGARFSKLAFRGPAEGSAEGAREACLDIGRGGAAIDGVDIEASDPAVIVRNGAELALSSSVLRGGGLRLMSGGKADIAEVVLRNAGASGVLVKGGAQLTAKRLTVEDAKQAGVLLAEGAAVRLEQLVVKASGNTGVEAVGGAHATLADAVIERSGQAGLFAADGARLVVERTRIIDSALSGAMASPGSELGIAATEIAGSGEHGVLVLDNAGAVVRESRISGNAGHGIALQASARFEGSGNTVEHNKDPQIVGERRADSPRQATAGR